MPQASALRTHTFSPAEMVLDMIRNILDDPKMNIQEKLAALRELCVQHISFNSPGQAVRIISGLAAITASDPSPEVRHAALEAMEHMTSLEEKAEAEQDSPSIDWRAVNVMLDKAKQQTELDTVPAVSRSRPSSPETAHPLPPEFKVSDDENSARPEAHAVSRDEDEVTSEETLLFATQEAAVVSINAAAAAKPMPAAVKPQPSGIKTPAVEEKDEPPIMKFLRSVADTDNEENIRVLANRIVAKIENLTIQKSPAPPSPILTEG